MVEANDTQLYEEIFRAPAFTAPQKSPHHLKSSEQQSPAKVSQYGRVLLISLEFLFVDDALRCLPNGTPQRADTGNRRTNMYLRIQDRGLWSGRVQLDGDNLVDLRAKNLCYNFSALVWIDCKYAQICQAT